MPLITDTHCSIVLLPLWFFSFVANINQFQETEEHKLARVMMSKKASRLYGRMQHGITQKVLKAESLQKRRKEIESSKEKGDDGKSMLRQKVDRLRKERKSIEKDYSGTGGSMKKNKNKKKQKKKRKVGVE